MTSLLLHTGPAPFSAADICDELGIDSQFVELLIKTKIEWFSIQQHARSETYAVTVGPRFAEEIVWASGRKPVEIGPIYVRDGVEVRDCRYEPNAERIAKAKAAVISWALRSNDSALMDAIAKGKGVVAARERTRAALQASLGQVA